MQIVRTVLWVFLLVGMLAFSFGNWDKELDVRIWPGIVWETNVPALVIIAFLIGLVPTWLYHRGVRWRLERRNAALETATTRMNAQRDEEAAAHPVRPEHTTAPAHPGQPAEPRNPIEPEPTTRP